MWIADIGQLFGQITGRTDLPGNPILTATGKRKLWPILFARQKGKCASCEIKTRLELMELDCITLGPGGRYRASNCQLLCGNCNRRKGAKTQTQFLAELRCYQTQLINPSYNKGMAKIYYCHKCDRLFILKLNQKLTRVSIDRIGPEGRRVVYICPDCAENALNEHQAELEQEADK